MSEHTDKMAIEHAEALDHLDAEGFDVYPSLEMRSHPDGAGYCFVGEFFARPGQGAILKTERNGEKIFAVDICYGRDRKKR